MAKIRIFLTDDHTLFRQGVKTLIDAEPDMEIVGESSSATDAIATAPELRPDVVLMDIGMPGLSSFEATRQIRKNRPETKLLFLTMPRHNCSRQFATSTAAEPISVPGCWRNWLTTSVRGLSPPPNYLASRP
jgi:DNA-binding NarL/FixJ family response regulator